jgi:sugar/nucleoside kinase (ribokinase family)
MRESLSEIASCADVLVGNEEDLQKGLGVEGPEIKPALPSIRPSSLA